MALWDEEYIEKIVELYRLNRDPAELTGLIHSNVDAMSSPAIGRLFLDMINGRLPNLEHRASSTATIRDRAVQLVIFYLGSNLPRTKAYAAAGKILNKHADTIRDYFKDWLKSMMVYSAWDIKDESDFFANPEPFVIAAPGIAYDIAFYDGRSLIDDELALKHKPDRFTLADWRKWITASYQEHSDIPVRDPWDEIEEMKWIKLDIERARDSKE